jgi:hypothetical protein
VAGGAVLLSIYRERAELEGAEARTVPVAAHRVAI